MTSFIGSGSSSVLLIWIRARSWVATRFVLLLRSLHPRPDPLTSPLLSSFVILFIHSVTSQMINSVAYRLHARLPGVFHFIDFIPYFILCFDLRLVFMSLYIFFNHLA